MASSCEQERETEMKSEGVLIEDSKLLRCLPLLGWVALDELLPEEVDGGCGRLFPVREVISLRNGMYDREPNSATSKV